MDTITEEAVSAALAENPSALAPTAAGASNLTIGPTHNDLLGSYKAGAGAWTVGVVDGLSADVLLMYAARVQQAMTAMGSPDQAERLPLDLRRRLFRERYPVRMSVE